MSIKYPTPQKNITNTKTVNHIKTLGMLFENALNESNDYYLKKGIANIHKKPTPIQVVKVDYPKRSASKIVEAYYKTPSTTDYNGIYRGKYIDFEAKETIKNIFSFKHIYKHQIEHLLNIKKLGGIAFVIIYFRISNEVYIFDIDVFYKLYLDETRKSISFNNAIEYGIKVDLGYTPLIDYLKAVDKLINN